MPLDAYGIPNRLHMIKPGTTATGSEACCSKSIERHPSSVRQDLDRNGGEGPPAEDEEIGIIAELK